MHSFKSHTINLPRKINSDEPISAFEEDLLFRGPLIERLTNLISNVEGNSPLTIAINAPWGYGKSSFLNLLDRSIQQKSSENLNMVKVIQFNPWHYSAVDDLVRAIFDELKSSMDGSNWIVRNFRRIRFNLLLKRFVSTASLGAYSPDWGLVFGILYSLYGCVCGKRKSLHNMREDLNKQLSSNSQRLVIIIDDIDRLERDALRILFKMLRLVMDFPNITYILAYDRKVVEKLLEDTENAREDTDNFIASRYLEKIVQLTIDLPQPEQSIVHDILITQMMETLEALPKINALPLDMHRWANMMHSGFLDHFCTIRNVKRYMNGLTMTLPMLAEEVDLVDFLAIELIRLFHPITYHELANSKNIFANKRNPNYVEKIKRINERLLDVATDDMIDELRDLLQEIFPQIQGVYNKIGYGNDFFASWQKAGRICAEENFDQFFLLAVPQGKIPEAVVRGVIDDLSNQKLTISTFRAAISQKTALGIIKRINHYIDEIPNQNLQILIRVLFELGDDIHPAMSNTSHLSRLDINSIQILIFSIMQKFSGNIQEKLLVEGINSGKSLWTVVGAIECFMPASGSSSQIDNLKLNDEKKIKSMAIERIRKHAADKSLWSVKGDPSALPFILHCWLAWGDEDELKSCIDSWIQDDDNLFAFLQSFASEIQSYSLGDKVHRTQNYVNNKELKFFVDVKIIQNRLNKIANTAGTRANEAKSLLDAILDPSKIR